MDKPDLVEHVVKHYAPHHEEDRRYILGEIDKLHREYQERLRPWIDRLVWIESVTPQSVYLVPQRPGVTAALGLDEMFEAARREKARKKGEPND